MATEGGKTFYEAEFEAGGKEVEIKVAPDGKLLGREIEDEDDDEDGDDDDDDEEAVSIDQVPAAVKATILKEAAGAKIEEIEKETKGGKTVYEAEFVVGGKEVEIEVAPDGKLLKREVDDD
ncbi:PepSY-like domain-containing protein [bacterium]|nr:PepSY-like domain-containing protein [bacterium]